MEKEFDPEDTRLVTAKLAGILTIRQRQARELVRSKPSQAAKIDRAMRDVAGKGARDWMNHSLAALPVEAWVSQDGTFAVQPTKQASLRYLIVDSPDPDAAFNHQHARSREALCAALFQELDADEQLAFGGMVQWGQLQVPDPVRHAYLCDVRIADSVYLVECLYYGFYRRIEAEKRSALALPIQKPTPPSLIRRLADAAHSQVRTCIENMSANSSPDDHLLVRVLCNIAANRALLESAKIADLARQAGQINIPFLEALNRNGITEVPEVGDDADIRAILQRWFGPSGSMAGEPGFERPLTGENLAATLARAREVQAAFVETRARSADPLAQQAFRSTEDRLIVALALVGSLYARAALDTELSGGKNKSYKAFPGPTSAFRHDSLPPHAMELFKCQFGQIAMANDGWNLSAGRVQEYASAIDYKRARLQELVFTTFKCWPASRLLALHTALMKERERV